MVDLRSKISKQQNSIRLVEPIALFESLSLRSNDVKELWRTQADALRNWHEERNQKDILFMLNTGAGKTLIGLLAALSLVNETKGKVLYICATNQLIEQTKTKAQEYGIPVTTYFSQGWVGDAYDKGIGPCITNYQAVLNGKSIFKKEEISAAIFDDAHTAYSVVQEQYTLRVNRFLFPDAWKEITLLIKEYFQSVNRLQRFTDVVEETDNISVLFVPTFLSSELSNKFRSILLQSGVTEIKQTKFVWEHVKDKLKYCSVLIDSSEIQFVPPLPPVQNQKCFSDDVRRLYLSATMSTKLSFSRTFGRLPDIVIEPGGRAGDCERMVLPQSTEVSDSDARELVQDATNDEKVLIMVPSTAASKPWQEYAQIFDTTEGNERLRKFARSQDEKLVLVARYDGIDLPGDDCRILIIDGLPTGTSHAERFFEQHLNIKGITNLLVASRITQMFGRISRGMSDYGVVMLVGGKLNRWLNDPRNRALLPVHIQKQLDLGDRLSEQYSEEVTLNLLLRRCLDRGEDWFDIYEEGMSSPISNPKDETEFEIIKEIATAERKFIENLWEDEPLEAAKNLVKLTLKIELIEPSLKAWYLHWLGFCLLLCKEDKAGSFYVDAARLKPELGRPLAEISEALNTEKNVSNQAQIISERLWETKYKSLERLELLKDSLVLSSSSNNTEEAIKEIGFWLGFNSSRPDNDYKKGPDNLWLTPDGLTAFVIECKTNKKSDSSYTKDEIGQYHQHIQWVKDTHPNANQLRIIIGPTCGCSRAANPPPELWAVPLENFYQISNSLRNIFENVLEEGLDIFYLSRIQDGIEKENLVWEKILDSLEKVNLSDL